MHSLSTDEAQLVKNSGVGWIRIDVSPNFGEAAVNAKAYNLKVLGILGSWMFDGKSTFTLEEWRDNVTYYVSQYTAYVDAWEIWNEPANPKYPLLNLNITIPESMSRVVDFYFSMVRIASPIIRQHDPNAKIVLFGGLNLWSGGDPHLELDKEFARQLANMSIKQYGDVISVHAYPWMTHIEPLIWEKYDENLAYYRELFPLEIWVTETGHPVNFEGETAQAQYTHDALGYFKEKGAKVFWYSLLDNAWEENHFGIVNNGTLRLAYYEIQKQKCC